MNSMDKDVHSTLSKLTFIQFFTELSKKCTFAMAQTLTDRLYYLLPDINIIFDLIDLR